MVTTPDARPLPSPAARPSNRPALVEVLRDAWRHDGRTSLLGAAAGAVLLALIYWRNLLHFGISWATDENYSHGFLVPIISLYFANMAAERGPVAVRGGLRFGAVVLGIATLVKLATVVIVVGTLGDLALLASAAGMVAVLCGMDALRRYGFAIFFLVFMIPLPVALYAMIASPLQLLVSKVASVALNATGVPVLTEGNMMTLPGGVQMFVAEACSGMRQLTGFLALTAAVAYLTRRPAWYKVAIIVSAIPIAITANVARVTLTGYIMYFVNPELASGTFHTVEGLLMLGFGLVLLRAWSLALDQLVDLTREQGPVDAGVGDRTRPVGAEWESAREGPSRGVESLPAVG